MEILKEKILELIGLQKEGDYWDFKADYTDNNADLIHDIICLANTPHHKGERYLVIGVSENTTVAKLYTITGLQGDGKSQADLIDLLKDKFSDTPPNITLHQLTFEDNKVDIIVIADENRKPYYLRDQHKDHKKTLFPGTIYTRVGDTNTPRNKVANRADVEAMWRQRFGLDLAGFEKLRHLMSTPEQWLKRGESCYFHELFPEYNIMIESQERPLCEPYSYITQV